MNEMTAVVVADHHPLTHIGVRAILDLEPDITLVGETADGYCVRDLIARLNPNLLIMDLNLPGPQPKEILEDVRKDFPRLKVLILTAHDEDVYVHAMVAEGVAGYMLKHEAPEELIHAIRTIMHGGTWFSKPIVKHLFCPNSDAIAAANSGLLTGRERHILSLIAQGWNNAQIATQIGLADQTVRNCSSRIYSKLGVNSRAEAIVWVRKGG
jgi:DNA-binding NarL/FixJ family response regulator